MKKVIAIILALAMVLGMTTAAFATPAEPDVKEFVEFVVKAYIHTPAPVKAAMAGATLATAAVTHEVAKKTVDYPIVGLNFDFTKYTPHEVEDLVKHLVINTVWGCLEHDSLMHSERFPSIFTKLGLGYYIDAFKNNALLTSVYLTYAILLPVLNPVVGFNGSGLVDDILAIARTLKLDVKETILFNDDPYGLYKVACTAKEGEWVYVKANPANVNVFGDDLMSRTQGFLFGGVKLYKYATIGGEEIYRFKMPARPVTTLDFVGYNAELVSVLDYK